MKVTMPATTMPTTTVTATKTLAIGAQRALPPLLATVLAMGACACGGDTNNVGSPLTNTAGAGTGTTSSTASTMMMPTSTVTNTATTTAPTVTMTATVKPTTEPSATMTMTTTKPPALPTGTTEPTVTTPPTMTTDDGPGSSDTAAPTMSSETDPSTDGTGGTGPVASGGGAGGMGGEVTPGGKAPVDPSEGCGKANPQTGSGGNPLMVSGHQYYVKLPDGYDADTPYPVVIMFNPTGNPITWAEGAAGFEAVAKSAIRIYPHMANQSSGWGGGDFSFFGPFYDQITADYCIDKARVFAGGESSGGEFVGALGCEHADKLRAVAPGAPKPMGAQYELDATKRQCTGQVTAVVIHSPKDNVLQQPVGEEMRDFYRDLNHCTEMSEPVDGYTDDLSNCVMYQGCDDGVPVYWCHHNDPEYGNTYHGWPHFAAKMLWELWSTY